MFNDISDSTQMIIILGGEVYKQYYIALYNALAEKTETHLYIPLMFNADGYVPTEQRRATLPHPDIMEQETQRIIYFSQNNA
jgi:hypothetical protein